MCNENRRQRGSDKNLRRWKIENTKKVVEIPRPRLTLRHPVESWKNWSKNKSRDVDVRCQQQFHPQFYRIQTGMSGYEKKVARQQ